MKDDFFDIENTDKNAASHLSEDEINSPEFDPEDFAPASEATGNDAPDDGARGRRAVMVFAIIAAVFTLITAAVGALGSEKIQNSDKNIHRDKVLAAFDNCSYARYYSTVEDCDIYAVIYNDKLAGYGIYKTVQGFGGDIEVLVCFDSANTVSTVKVISENESKGLGSKIRKKDFLSEFVGLSSDNISSMDVDMISGATASSDAVKNAVSDVVKLGISSFSIAKDLGIETISRSEIDSDIDKDTDDADTDDGDDTTKTTEALTTKVIDSSKLDGENGGAGNNSHSSGEISVDVSDVTTVYESEGETTDTTGEETSEAAPVDTPKVTTAADTPVVSDTSSEVSSEEPISSETADSSAETDPPAPDTTGADSDDETKEPVDNSQGEITE